nr:Mur ligase family protein [uncultured Mogibacterium sp.]
MGKLRFFCALLIAKLSIIALKITRHNATNFPGIVAIKICPDFLKYIELPDKIIGVTGTNGKTTCSNLLNDSLTVLGERVLNNSAGSNTITGITTSLITSVNLIGKQKFGKAIFEIDELSSRRIFPFVHVDYLVVTNLSRDSIMRNAHPDYIKSVLEAHIDKSTRLILNADDLISSQMCRGNERVFFGIDALHSDKCNCTNLIDDCPICPVCNSKLKYSRNRYSNIGRAYCPNCDFKSPEADYLATNVNIEDMTMNIVLEGESCKFKLFNNGTFNIYNELTLITVLSELRYSLDEIKAAVSRVGITKERLNEFEAGGIKLSSVLCKDRNAYASSRVFEYIEAQPGDKELLLFNNNFQDDATWSENMCWLYDADFELLADDRIKTIITTGSRGLDFKLRLLTAGIPEEKIKYVSDAIDCINELKFIEGETIYLLYGTDPLSPARKVRKKLEEHLENIEKVK